MALLTTFSVSDLAKFKIDSPDKAYSLGFMWGDAHLRSHKVKTGVSHIHYPFTEINRDDLLCIKDTFNAWGNCSIKYRHRENRKPQGVIALYDKYFGWFLACNDYLVKSKEEPTKILSIIPPELKHYWWRGFIDADGCFYIRRQSSSFQFSIAGAYGYNWTETISLFSDLGIQKFQVQQRIHSKSKSSAIRMSNITNIVKLGNYLYQDDKSIGLYRKYMKFMDIKNQL